MKFVGIRYTERLANTGRSARSTPGLSLMAIWFDSKNNDRRPHFRVDGQNCWDWSIATGTPYP